IGRQPRRSTFRIANYQLKIFNLQLMLQASSAPRPSGRRLLERPGLLCLLLVLAVLAVYLPVVEFSFLCFDDTAYVWRNPRIRGGLTWQNLSWAFTHVHGSNWHPLTSLSHMLDCQLYGLRAGAHHLTSVLFHAANTALLFLWLRSATGALWRSAFVAALFGLHPLHVESVAWVAERKDVLSTFFGLLCLIAYVLYAARATTARYAVAIVTFILSLLSKQMLVTLPVVLLLLDFWPMERFSFAPGRSKTFRRQNTRRLFVEKLRPGANENRSMGQK